MLPDSVKPMSCQLICFGIIFLNIETSSIDEYPIYYASYEWQFLGYLDTKLNIL